MNAHVLRLTLINCSILIHLSDYSLAPCGQSFWPYHCYQNLKFSFLPFLFTTLNSCTDYVHSKCFQSSLNFSIIQKLFYLFYSAIFPHSLQWLIKSVRFLFSCFSLILRLLGSLILPLLKPCCMFNSGFGTSYPKVLDFKDLKSVTKGRE